MSDPEHAGDPHPVTVLTGATSDIGQAIARRLIGDGHALCLLGRDAERLDAVARALRTLGASLVGVYVHDLRRPLDPRLTEALARCRPSSVVHAAGVAYADRWERTTADEWHQMFAVHVAGFADLMRALRDGLVARRGSIVAVASVDAGYAPRAWPASAYAATKAALTTYARSLAVELGPYGVRVNVVWPGAMVSGMGSALAGASEDPRHTARAEALRQDIPLRRFGSPEDVAGVVRFLLGPDSAYVTGTVLTVDGGLTAAYGPP